MVYPQTPPPTCPILRSCQLRKGTLTEHLLNMLTNTIFSQADIWWSLRIGRREKKTQACPRMCTSSSQFIRTGFSICHSKLAVANKDSVVHTSCRKRGDYYGHLNTEGTRKKESVKCKKHYLLFIFLIPYGLRN